MSEEEAAEQAETLVKSMRESQDRYRRQQLAQYVESGMTEEEAQRQLDLMDEYQNQYTRERRSMVNGLAVAGEDLFVTCNDPNGTGFAVWRLPCGLDADAVQIVTKLRGCCGQMDIEARDGALYVAENAGHHVLKYDRDGKPVGEFGENNSEAPEGFGGCCEPKNLRFDVNGLLYACESGPPVIVRSFTADGEFKGVVGFPSFQTGCVRVTVDVSEDLETVYVLNADASAIHVLTRRESE